MARDFMCRYGNCTNDVTPIVISEKATAGERSRFCCWEHAGLHALRRAWQYEGHWHVSYADTIRAKLDAEFK